jgi:hypothetical protein
VIILIISPVCISQTVGSHIIFLIQASAFSAHTLSFQVTKVFPSSSICIFTSKVASAFWIFSHHLPIISLILSTGTSILSIRGAYGESSLFDSAIMLFISHNI